MFSLNTDQSYVAVLRGSAHQSKIPMKRFHWMKNQWAHLFEFHTFCDSRSCLTRRYVSVFMCSNRANFTYLVDRFLYKPFYGNSADLFSIDFNGPRVNYRGLFPSIFWENCREFHSLGRPIISCKL